MSILGKTCFFLIGTISIVATLAYGTVHQPVIALFYLSVTVLGLLFTADAVISGKLELSFHPLQIPLVLLAIYGSVQVIPFGEAADSVSGVGRTISLEPFATNTTALHILALSAFFFTALSCLNSAARLRRMVSALAVFGFAYSFYAILQSVLSPERIYGIYKPAAGIPFGSFVNKHDFAAVIEMLIALPIGIALAGGLKGDKKLLYGVAIAIMGAALLLSGSRGGLVALIAEVIFILIITTRGHGRRTLMLKAGLSAALLISAVAGAVFVGGDTSLTRISETAFSDDVTSSRTQIWSVTLDVIKENLPFGAGLGAFPQAYTRHDPSGGFERVEQAHNDYLQVVADAGVIGLILGAVWLFLFARQGMRSAAVSNASRRGIAIGAFAGCFGVLVHSLFDFVLHITAVSLIFLTLLAILAACGRKYADDVDLEGIEGHQHRRRRRSASVTPIESKASPI